MLRTSLLFFIVGLIAAMLGFNNVAGLSFEVGRVLLFVFLTLAILFFVGALIVGRRIGPKL